MPQTLRLSAGFSYTLAPGLTTFAEYVYGDQTQNFNNFNNGNNLNGTAQGSFSKSNNNWRGQSILIGDIVSF